LPLPLQPLNYANGDYLAPFNTLNRNGFIVDAAWQPKDSAKTRPGFVHVPMLTSEQAGASFDLEFTGTAVGIAAVSGPDAGIIRYSIDGRNETLLDTYNRYSKSLHLPQYFLLADGLDRRKHFLRVTILDNHNKESKGTALRITNFLVNQ
jgi:hypothetical protein